VVVGGRRIAAFLSRKEPLGGFLHRASLRHRHFELERAIEPRNLLLTMDKKGDRLMSETDPAVSDSFLRLA
jgi:hypothetical protein